MASSSGSLETSTNSHPQNNNFTFSTSPFMTSFSDLLASGDDFITTTTSTTNRRVGLSERIAERSGVPKFKSIQPPSLPISPPSLTSPSSYFAIPPGLSPAELLDSPVLLNASTILPSPTTGTFPGLNVNWKSSNNSVNEQENVKPEDKITSDFSFPQSARPSTNSSSMFQYSNSTIQSGPQQSWGFQQSAKQDDFASENGMVKSEFSSMKSFSPEIAAVQTSNTDVSNGFQADYTNQQPHYQSIREQKRSEDGYNWRKYGQKQVKGSENPRSYYKCTYPNCPTKKKVERSIDGQITEIVYKGSHNHPKPQSTRRSASSSLSSIVYNPPIQASNPVTSDNGKEHSLSAQLSGQLDSAATPENSSISMGEDDFDSQKSKSGGDDFDDEEPEAKRWKREGDNEGISAAGSRTVREPRVVVQTTSDIDILDDGYRWRKYGQKVVKGNPNPRSYYKCTHPGCPVRKHVERASHDLRAVITTYEGKHNHDVPAARGSGSRQISENNNGNSHNANIAAMASAMNRFSANTSNSLRSLRPQGAPSEQGAPFTLDMLQSPGSLGLFGNPMAAYMNQTSAKAEPRDETFLESLLC